MNKFNVIKTMLGDLPLSAVDVIRLFVETLERAGLEKMPRELILQKYRQMIGAGIRVMQESERTVSFAQAVQYSLDSRSKRRPGTLADLRSYTGRMLRHENWAQKPLRSITTQECRKLLGELFGHSPTTYRKGRSILHSIFSYGRRQGWCSANPVADIEVPTVCEQKIEILKPQEINRLRKTCLHEYREMVVPVTLMLWCGIRPGEVRRMRWEDIDWKEGVAYIEPRVSKTGGARIVELRGAARFLRPPEGSDPQGLIAPPSWDKRWRLLRKQAGLLDWQQDKLRHTFASMHLRHYRNPALLQAEMGHRNSDLLRTRYLNLRGLSAAGARHFWESRML